MCKDAIDEHVLRPLIALALRLCRKYCVLRIHCTDMFHSSRYTRKQTVESQMLADPLHGPEHTSNVQALLQDIDHMLQRCVIYAYTYIHTYTCIPTAQVPFVYR